MSFKLKFFDDNKKYYLYDRYVVSNQNFTNEHDKVTKNLGFSRSFICLGCQVQDLF